MERYAYGVPSKHKYNDRMRIIGKFLKDCMLHYILTEI